MTQTKPVATASSTGKWKAYPAYKDSGVAWLGEIPAQWEVKRLRFICQINPSKIALLHLQTDTQVSFVPMEHIGEDGTLSLEEIRTIEQVWQGYTCFRNGDVIIAKITPCFENGKGALCHQLLNGIGFGTTELHVLRTNDETDPKFIFYLTKSKPFREIGAAMMYGAAGQQRIPEDFISDFRLGLPSLPEQRAITAFLDHETAKINTLIAKKERLIELLQEKRAALISHAVTKGLDPTVPMKDSGVEWLGKIPVHWEVKRMKYVAKQETGHTPSRQHPEYWENCTIPWVSLADVWQLRDVHREYIEDTNEYISEIGIANSSARLLPAGTVIVSRTASVGFSGIMARPMATTQDFANWVCGPLIRSEFLLYVFRSMEHEFRRLVMGSTHQTIYMPDIRRFITPLPPYFEQDAIVEFIRKETAKIDALITRIREGIEKLKEYSTALISAAVTGKIDVRGEILSKDDETSRVEEGISTLN